MNNADNLTYDKSHDQFETIDDDTTEILKWIGSDCEVLEIGCHTGYLAKWLKAQSCSTTGIEINEAAIEKASRYLERSISGSIEDDHIRSKIESNDYEVVIAMHVLEHLVDPWEALQYLVGKVKPDGMLILGLPNVSNIQTRIKMFKGQFEYEEEGVMDRTHLRFFNYKTANELIKSAGLNVEGYHSAWRLNPLREIISAIPFFGGFGKLVGHRGMSKFSRNSTDVVMMFQCRKM